MLYLKNLTYHPPATPIAILKALNLELAPQELGLVIGPSGSGKSTLLEILAGLAEQTAGGIFWRDQELIAEQLQQLAGLVFQFPERHFCGGTILENCGWGIRSWVQRRFMKPWGKSDWLIYPCKPHPMP
jgi:energy-coupling factor transport system ATP-binding protein